MTGHSSIVGGSNAARLLNCPASYQATRALPPSADISSEYAEEGTAMHEVMTRLMRIRQLTERKGRPFNPFIEARRWLDSKFHDRALTQDHLDTMIEPALRHLVELEKIYNAPKDGMPPWSAPDPFRVLAVEESYAFPGIPGAFGTVDLVLGNTNTVLHVDWKFGQGVGVAAVYPDPEGDIINAQLMFYLAAARHSARHMYVGRSAGTSKPPILVVSIIQPRSETPLTHTKVTAREVKWFVEDLQNAVVEALDRDPLMAKGEHCRFAPCKVACPLWTDTMLDLSMLPGMPKPAEQKVERMVTPYGEYLAKAKVLVDVLALFKKEVDEQLHAYLEDGGLVPGWRLKAKAKQRQWVDEDTVEQALTDLGFAMDEIWESKLVTFAKADAAAKRRGVKIPDELRVAPATTETTVAATDDPAPVIDRQGAAEAFRESLKALTAK